MCFARRFVCDAAHTQSQLPVLVFEKRNRGIHEVRERGAHPNPRIMVDEHIGKPLLAHAAAALPQGGQTVEECSQDVPITLFGPILGEPPLDAHHFLFGRVLRAVCVRSPSGFG